jgi:hypothetical protein
MKAGFRTWELALPPRIKYPDKHPMMSYCLPLSHNSVACKHFFFFFFLFSYFSPVLGMGAGTLHKLSSTPNIGFFSYQLP